MAESLFEKISNGSIPSWIVWENETHIAFLTPFANTPGVTVVCPRKNPGDYVFALEETHLDDLMGAVKLVSKGLEKALGVSRVGLVIEGTGVPHIHAKLYPMHGNLASKTNVWPQHQEFYPEYAGYLTTVEGPKMADSELDALQNKIRNSF